MAWGLGRGGGFCRGGGTHGKGFSGGFNLPKSVA